MIRRIFTFLLLIFVLVGCGRLNPYPAATPQPALPTPTSNTEIDLPAFYEPDPTQPLKFQRLTVEDGLTQSSVYTIIQDQDGFLWFGTWDGLNRYDGKSLKKYRNNLQDSNSLSNNTVWVLYVDRKGTLWVGTNGGLNKYDPLTDRFTRYLHDPEDSTSLSNNRIGFIYEDTMGNFWVGTRGGGLDRLDRENGTFSHFAHDPRNDATLSDNYVSAILETHTGELWVGTWGGLDRMNPLSGRFIHFRHKEDDSSTISSNLVQTLTEDDYGRLWIGTVEGGLDEYNPVTRSFLHNTRSATSINSLSDNTVLEVMKDSEGDLWIGTKNGLTRLQTHSGRMIRYNYNPYDPEDAESLSQPVVSSVYQDRSGVYWFGTDGGGVNYFVPFTRIFQHYHTEPNDSSSLSSNIVWSFIKDRDGDLWVGTNNGLNRLDRIGHSFTHFFNDPQDPNSLYGNNVAVLYEDEDKNIWLGTDQGLCRYDRSTNHFVRYYRTATHGESTEPLTIPGPGIVSITPVANGDLLLGTTGEGLWVLKAGGSDVVPFTYNHQVLADLENTTIFTSLVDADGNLWIGTFPSIAHEGGLFRLNPENGTLSRYLNNPGDRRTISNNTILSLHLDLAGRLWVGTAAGLNRFDAKTGVFRQYLEQAGLPNDVINSIQEDADGNLWVSTNVGISRFSPDNEIFKNFNSKDGLQSNEFNVAAGYHDSVGQLYFGGINGFSVFNPEHVRSNGYVPPVLVTSLSQGGVPIETNKPPEKLTQLTLNWPRNYFEFEFTALNYIHPEDNRYTYILEGFDHDWNMVGSQTFGRYTNLPGGSYVLRIRAANNDGVWNDVGTKLKIVVVPPLWEETWFQWGGGLLVLSILFNVFRLRVRSMQKHNQDLSQQVAERTREIDQRRKVAEGLRDILVQINSNRSLPETLAFITRQVSSLAHPQHVLLFEILKQNRVNILASAFSPQFPASLPDQLSVSEVKYPQEVLEWFTYLVRSATPREIVDLPVALRHRFGTIPVELKGLNTLWVFPISPEGEVFGGLVVLYTKRREMSSDEMNLLTSFADQASLAVGNAQLRAKAEELAVVTERTRLARDLHDAVTQTLFSASLLAESIPPVWQNNQAEGKRLLGELRQLNRGALAEMRSLLMELRPAALVEARMEDLLRQLAESLAGRTGMHVEQDVQKDLHLPKDVHVALYRIAQEALSNIVKHARAKNVTLVLTGQPTSGKTGPSGITVTLEVSDDGIGFDHPATKFDHYGLNNMRERAQAIGATMTIESQPGTGTHIKVRWEGKVDVND